MSVTPKSYRAAVEFTFNFPDDLVDEIGYKDVTLRELTNSAESQAMANAGQDGAVLMSNLVTSSLVRATKVDGATLNISRADDSVDQFMSEIGPKGRALVNLAFGSVNTPKKEQGEVFLKSARARSV